jgi:large subunit ribosomal protein L1
MPKHGKRYLEARKQIEPGKLYLPKDAVALVKRIAYADFDEAIELHLRLNIDPRQADQTVRGTVVLPHGTGRTPRVLVFAVGEAARVAEEAGADYVGSDELIRQIQAGWLEFDVAIAMADQMGKVGPLGRILGRRGLMPNPRAGTVVRVPEDLPGVIQEVKRGRIEFRNDRTGNIHAVIGRKQFTDQQLLENLYTFADAISRARPSAVRGQFIRSMTVASTMSPGVPLDVSQTLAEAQEFVA